MIRFKHFGNFDNSERFFRKARNLDAQRILEAYGRKGVLALSSATPKDTGMAASSWSFEIQVTRKGFGINWVNSDVTESGTPIVILLQYGHGTGTGGYVEGQDFINPAIRPIFDEIAENVFKEVNQL